MLLKKTHLLVVGLTWAGHYYIDKMDLYYGLTKPCNFKNKFGRTLLLWTKLFPYLNPMKYHHKRFKFYFTNGILLD